MRRQDPGSEGAGYAARSPFSCPGVASDLLSKNRS
jgi:hypothetical protein